MFSSRLQQATPNDSSPQPTSTNSRQQHTSARQPQPATHTRKHIQWTTDTKQSRTHDNQEQTHY
eukprot:3423600-Alexandrium_andersonii.AAC.1